MIEQVAKILIVDDTLANIIVLEKILKKAGYGHIRTLDDSRLTLDAYLSFDPDCILLDLNMPFIDGMEVLDQLKQAAKDAIVPVIMITAHDEREKRHLALQKGARDFISKPFDMIELLFRIKNVCEFHLLHRQTMTTNQRLEEKVIERTRELRQTQIELINRLGRAAEFRDNETGHHITRMSLYAGALAKALGWSEEQQQLLILASTMHDIGKIGIPDEILLKPGKLTEDEFALMQTHASIGSAILANSESPMIRLAEEIARTHHERWDGSGYPDALSGENIPISGRIAAVCDVFDALTSERPYKRAWTVEEAIDEMKRTSGRHFDPYLIELFVAILPEILAIKERYAN